MARPIVLDCDPGHDDAIALLVAFAAPTIEPLAVTTVAGNQTLENTTMNARRIRALAGREAVPIAAGCPTPLVRELQTAPEVHGEHGLAGSELPAPTVGTDDRHAVSALLETVEAADDPVTLVALGPLTNVALALSIRPTIVDELDEIVVMGGAHGPGNVTPAAEFNVFVDPEAAAIVFDAPVPVTMVGLDATRAARFPIDRIERFRELGGSVGPVVADLLEFYATAEAKRFDPPATPVHDALAVCSVLDRSLLETERMPVSVETAGLATRGETVCDRWGVGEDDRTVAVALDADAEAFHTRLFEEIERY